MMSNKRHKEDSPKRVFCLISTGEDGRTTRAWFETREQAERAATERGGQWRIETFSI
jgi:hypothetical protein